MPKKNNESKPVKIFNFTLSVLTGSLISAVVMFGVSKLALFSLFKITDISSSSVKKFFILMAVSYFALLLLSLLWSFILSKIAGKMISGKYRKGSASKYFSLVSLAFFTLSSGFSSGFVYTDAFIDSAGLNPEKTALPDLYGLNLESAQILLYEHGFDSVPISNIHYSNLSSEMPDSVIIRQDPPAGTYISDPSQIEIWINVLSDNIDLAPDSMQTIPHLGGLPLERALVIMSSKNFSFEIESLYCDTVQENWIIGSSPEGGSDAVPGSRIRIFVSLGSRTVIVPSVLDMKLNEAELMLKNMGLVVFVDSETTNPSPPNTVISQFPPPGDTSFNGDTIRVIVSSGIPDTMEF